MQPNTYKNYLLFFLMAILAFSYVDRMVFGIVLDYIRADLHLTDTQMGLVGGIGFALFFAIMGIPIARWGDRGDRAAIISVTTAVWSIAVALCGVAGSFVELFLIRISVAAGEAGCSPLASSLIPDYFLRAERPRAFARYYLGVSIGTMIGYFAGGWLNQMYRWRATFMVVGLPGLMLAAVAGLTFREPRRLTRAHAQRSARSDSFDELHPPLKSVVVRLWGNVTLRRLLVFFSVWYCFGWGLQQWLPTFFIRSHHLATGELGTWLALAYGCSGLVGAWLGGGLATRYAAHNERLQLRVGVALFLLEGLCYATSLTISNTYCALGAVMFANLLESIAQGPIFATIQTLVPARMRAITLALVSLFPNLIGAGLGPVAAGALSDALNGWAGEQSLRYALLILCPGYFWAASHLWRASQTVNRDWAALQADEKEAPVEQSGELSCRT